MAQLEGTLAERLTLVDTIDHLLNRGVVLAGEATLSLAGVELVYLGLNVVLASVETLQQNGSPLSRPVSASEKGVVPRFPSRPDQGKGRTLEPAPLRSVGGGWYAGTQETGRELDPEREPADNPLAILKQAVGEGEPSQDESRPERGLARLVLALVELLRQVLERQAMRRMEGGGLSEADVERMGLTLLELEAKMGELRAAFGLENEDLNVDLGPLGKLV